MLQLPVEYDGIDSLITENESLLQEQRRYYDALFSLFDKDRFKCISEDERDEALNNSTNSIDDPLSFLAQEEEAREARDLREKLQRQKSKMVDIVQSYDIIKLVKIDLIRLPRDHDSLFLNHPENQTTAFEESGISSWREDQFASFDEDEISIEEDRNEILTEILHVFARGHEEVGYIQGMHELASYCLLAMEKDLIDAEIARCHDYDKIMGRSFLRHDVFSLFEALMECVEYAYKDDEKSNEEESEPIQETIVQNLLYMSNGKSLCEHLQKKQISTKLYSARWVRLMFAREVGDWHSTLKLWDVFFDCITKEKLVESNLSIGAKNHGESSSASLVGAFDLKTVLEMTATSLLWMNREHLFSRHPDEALQDIHSSGILHNIEPLLSALLNGLQNVKEAASLSSSKRTGSSRGERNSSVTKNVGRRSSTSGIRNLLSRSLQPLKSALPSRLSSLQPLTSALPSRLSKVRRRITWTSTHEAKETKTESDYVGFRGQLSIHQAPSYRKVLDHGESCSSENPSEPFPVSRSTHRESIGSFGSTSCSSSGSSHSRGSLVLLEDFPECENDDLLEDFPSCENVKDDIPPKEDKVPKTRWQECNRSIYSSRIHSSKMKLLLREMSKSSLFQESMTTIENK